MSAAKQPLLDVRSLLGGYYEGKGRAEAAVATTYGEKGTVLRPGFVHGEKLTPSGTSINLSLLGSPMEFVLRSTPLGALKVRGSTG